MSDIEDQKPAKKEKKQRPPKVVTPALLRGQALRYLDRFAATTMKMQRHLLTKNRKAIEFHDMDVDTVLQMIDLEIEKLIKAGILNDQEYASSKARSMARQAKSKLQIEVKLQGLGFDESQSGQAITRLIEEEGHSDTIAAAKYIRKRRFGPYKPAETRDERRNKELSALARNGFEFGLASRMLDLNTIEELEEIIFGSGQ